MRVYRLRNQRNELGLFGVRDAGGSKSAASCRIPEGLYHELLLPTRFPLMPLCGFLPDQSTDACARLNLQQAVTLLEQILAISGKDYATCCPALRCAGVQTAGKSYKFCYTATLRIE